MPSFGNTLLGMTLKDALASESKKENCESPAKEGSNSP